MTIPMTMSGPDVLDREFLEVRAKLLEVAATLDRLDRAEGDVSGDDRLAKIDQALQILRVDSGQKYFGRAEQLQLLFSRQYEDDWREQFQLPISV